MRNFLQDIRCGFRMIVTGRRSEIGIRIALGANRTDVVKIVLSQTLQLLLVEVAVGVALALAAGRGANSLLYGLRPSDPLTFAGAIVFLLAVGLLATFIPVHRASRVDPMAALRYE